MTRKPLGSTSRTLETGRKVGLLYRDRNSSASDESRILHWFENESKQSSAKKQNGPSKSVQIEEVVARQVRREIDAPSVFLCRDNSDHMYITLPSHCRSIRREQVTSRRKNAWNKFTNSTPKQRCSFIRSLDVCRRFMHILVFQQPTPLKDNVDLTCSSHPHESSPEVTTGNGTRRRRTIRSAPRTRVVYHRVQDISHW